ncbi:MAG: DNA repair protein RecN [Cyclobacteriaceae bacterium]|nr:DNA repair protein RecN [Cyclobacteriaceae bacterium]MCH8516062.1 DNA repair protein RecN [Cyclobacteriaceae bacterium]
MLKKLKIHNYALIRELEIAPHEAFNVITGETGAGKSIMLGAMGLILGQRADKKVLLAEDKKCAVEAVFDLSRFPLQKFFEDNDLDFEIETIIRREISPSGKSRAFVNDTPTTLDVIKALSGRLMDIHSQHDNLRLGDDDFQLATVDAYAANVDLKSEYAEKWKYYRSIDKQLRALEANAADWKKEQDYHQFLFDELSGLKLEAKEQEGLEEELKSLENAEDIKQKLSAALAALSGDEVSIDTLLTHALSEVRGLKDFGSTYSEFFSRLESAAIELRDLAQEMERTEENTLLDDARLVAVKERLDKIYQLFRKHQVDNISDLLAIQADLEIKLEEVNNLDADLERLSTEKKAALQSLKKAAERLSASRQKALKPLSDEIQTLVRELGMPDAQVKLTRDAIDYATSGIDEVKFLFSANKGIAVADVSKRASGGEFSRLIFCLKYILADKLAMPTIIFDEIDTGISGEVAIKMAGMMRKMSQSHQVISISHLPQFAAKGHKHYFVYKDNQEAVTQSRMKELSEDERVMEIAKMIGGDQAGVQAIESAKELLARA